MLHLPSFLLVLSISGLALPIVAASRTVYRAENISQITLYGDSSVYLPSHCPHQIEFAARARHFSQLAPDKIAILPRDIIIDGNRCTSDALMLDFSPLGRTDHFPPQWVFEDSRFHGHPVNFTCGASQLSLRFGYFNDVSTTETGGMLKPELVYLDFAVIPNTRPFAYCSYAGRRENGKRPLDFAPFPSQATWKSYHEQRERTHPALKRSNDAEVSPQPEETMEAERSMEPEANMESEDQDTNQQNPPSNNNQQDVPPNNMQQGMPPNNMQQMMAPGQDR